MENGSISEADAAGSHLCYCSAFWPSDRLRGRGEAECFEERRDVLRADASHPVKLISQKATRPSFEAHHERVGVPVFLVINRWILLELLDDG